MEETNITPNRPPKNWLVESILVTVFCCLPFGIVGIVHATKVDTKYGAGDYAGAEQASADAKKWTMIGFWIGVAVLVIYLLMFALGIGGMMASGEFQ